MNEKDIQKISLNYLVRGVCFYERKRALFVWNRHFLSHHIIPPSNSPTEEAVSSFWDQQNVLWFPEEYAPASIASHGDVVAVGCRHGSVLFMEIN
jgi:hypothetical protein